MTTQKITSLPRSAHRAPGRAPATTQTTITRRMRRMVDAARVAPCKRAHDVVIGVDPSRSVSEFPHVVRCTRCDAWFGSWLDALTPRQLGVVHRGTAARYERMFRAPRCRCQVSPLVAVDFETATPAPFAPGEVIRRPQWLDDLMRPAPLSPVDFDRELVADLAGTGTLADPSPRVAAARPGDLVEAAFGDGAEYADAVRRMTERLESITRTRSNPFRPRTNTVGDVATAALPRRFRPVDLPSIPAWPTPDHLEQVAEALRNITATRRDTNH